MGADQLQAYVPRLLRDLAPWDGPRSVQGVLASVDLSGFTALSERLAAHGREGAEELTRLLTAVFTQMIEDAEVAGGDVLSFGGDALLVLFRPVDTQADLHDEPARRAVGAVARMVGRVAAPLESPLAGTVRLATSVGLHLGTFHLAALDVGHAQLTPFGPDVSACLRAESAAEAGRVLVTRELADHLPDPWLGATSTRHVTVDLETVLRAGGPATVTPRPDVVSRGQPGAFLPPGLVREVVAGTRLGEHRRVAVAFLWLGGLDGVVEHDGADVAASELAALGQALAGAVAHTGVHVLASDAAPDGVKLILAAGAPTSVGDDEAALLGTVRAGLTVATRLTCKAGANRGPVFVGDLGGPTRRTLTVMGDAVNLAARLMQAAEPGQLVASQALLERSSVRFATSPLPPFHVKGKAEPVVAAVVGPREGVRVADPDDLALIGREPQLARLDAHLDALRAGRGGVVSIIGEPGSGRSHVLAELVRRAAGCTVALEVATRDERGSGVGPVTRVLRRVIGLPAAGDAAMLGADVRDRLRSARPELLPLSPLLGLTLGVELSPTPESQAIDPRFRVRRAHAVLVATLGALLPGPTVLALDGLHHADEATRGLVQALASAAADHGWLVAVSRPPDDELAIDGADRVVLPPLDDAAIRRLLVERPDVAAPLHDHDVDRVVRRAGGNPMYALELARAIAEGHGDELPETVEALATARIDRLPPHARALVRDAAVLGLEVPAAWASRLLDPPQLGAGARGAAAEFLDTSGPLWRFRHALYQQAAYDAASFLRRRELHAQVAGLLATTAGDADPRTSFHLARAGDHAAAWHAAVAAAEAARDRQANADALEMYERALEQADALGLAGSELAAVAEATGDAAERASRYAAADAAYRRALAEAAATVDRARLERKLGDVRERQGDYAGALPHYDRGVALLTGRDDPEAVTERAAIGIAVAGLHYRRGRLGDCIREAAHAEAAAAGVGDRSLLAHARYLGGHARSLHGQDGRPLQEAALRVYEALGDLYGQANVHNNLGVEAYFAGRWDASLDHYERALTRRQRAGDVAGAAMQVNNLAEILSDRGVWEVAVERFVEAERTWRAVGSAAGVGLARSNLARARSRIAGAAADQAGIEASITALRAVVERFEAIDAAAFAEEARIRLAESLLLAWRTREADEVLAVGPGADATGPALVARRRTDAIVTAQLGDLDAALDASLAAGRAAPAGDARYELALARLVHAAILQQRGEPSAVVRAVAADAHAGLAQLGVARVVLATVSRTEVPVVTVRPGSPARR